ncbi:hypothetical protein PR048_028266 [Dryococelus australis]|uniref:Secreted protein n=1 Tax=Dryococelus australis TaxID=614101 RepID=A0ABQ9GIP4_9NEOP|nr:hypothetical protein PR048_028266 [Dryococelus australis]
MLLNLLVTVCTIHTTFMYGRTEIYVIQLCGAIREFCRERFGRVASLTHLANAPTVLANSPVALFEDAHLHNRKTMRYH